MKSEPNIVSIAFDDEAGTRVPQGLAVPDAGRARRAQGAVARQISLPLHYVVIRDSPGRRKVHHEVPRARLRLQFIQPHARDLTAMPAKAATRYVLLGEERRGLRSA
jgi:hypothetical protein